MRRDDRHAKKVARLAVVSAEAVAAIFRASEEDGEERALVPHAARLRAVVAALEALAVCG